MITIYFLVSLWFLGAVLSAVIANWFKITIALMEIIIGAIIGYCAYKLNLLDKLDLQSDWLKLLSGIGAVLLTFLAGAELNPDVLKKKVSEVSIVGLTGFFAPFIGCALLAYYGIGWSLQASLLCGIALSTTSMAVVYAVMLEYRLNKTEYGKGILGACFINDLGTVIALGLIFSPFTYKTLLFVAVLIVLVFVLPPITNFLINRYAHKTSAIRTKWLLFILLSMGVFALWTDSEPVLPAYILGMTLARIIDKDINFVRRLRTLTVGFLTPLYFLRAGALMSIPAIFTAPVLFVLLLLGKVFSKIFGLVPIINFFTNNKKEKWYYTLLMSTGLTFGTISALYGLSHNIISQEQYSLIVCAVIASAVIPTIIANKFFLPVHLIKKEHTNNPTTINT